MTTSAPSPPQPRCPRCRGALVDLSVTSLGELRCAMCQGAWLDSPGVEVLANELGMRVKTFIARIRAAYAPILGAVHCIRCQRPMARLSLRTVEVDACARCGGMWRDSGDLQRVSSGRHAEPAPGEVRQRLLSEANVQTYAELQRLQRSLEAPPAGARALLMHVVEALEEMAEQLPKPEDALDRFEALLARILGPPPDK